MLVKKLEERTISRIDVKYYAAPPASGKTCGVLPAFLRSAEREGGFTHYIYIAFRNNNKRTFVADPPEPDNNTNVAKEQGATFIIHCLKQILYDQEPNSGLGCMININENTVSSDKNANEYIYCSIYKELQKNALITNCFSHSVPSN